MRENILCIYLSFAKETHAKLLKKMHLFNLSEFFNLKNRDSSKNTASFQHHLLILSEKKISPW